LISSRWWHTRDMALLGVQIAAAASVRRGARPARHPVFRQGILPLAFLLILIDLAPISLVTTYEAHRTVRDQAYGKLADRLGSGRFLELPADAAGRVTPSLWGYAPTTPTPSIGGPSLRSVPRSFAHTAAMVDTVARALARGGSLNPALIRLLAFHNVRYVIFSTPRGHTLLKGVEGDGFVPDLDVPGFRVEGASPVVVLEPGGDPGSEPPAEAIGREGLSPAASRALARESLAWLQRARPRPVIEARSVPLPNRLEIELPDLGPVTIRIARNSYPRTELLLDGQPWPWREGPLGGTVIDLPRGAHRIEIRAIEDRIRKICRYAQWGLAAILFLIAISPHRH